jgi:hypothetical protein
MLSVTMSRCRSRSRYFSGCRARGRPLAEQRRTVDPRDADGDLGLDVVLRVTPCEREGVGGHASLRWVMRKNAFRRLAACYEIRITTKDTKDTKEY